MILHGICEVAGTQYLLSILPQLRKMRFFLAHAAAGACGMNAANHHVHTLLPAFYHFFVYFAFLCTRIRAIFAGGIV